MSVASVGRAVRESVSGLPREFWWLWTSTLINRLGAFVSIFLALFITVDQGRSASYAGLVASLLGLGSVVSSIGGGVMTDRLGRRPTLLVAQASTAVAVAVLGFMTDPVAIAVVAFVVGMASNASRPAVQAMIADIVPPADRVRAFALNFWAINLGFAVSSIAAGFIARYSYLAGFLGEAVMTLACAVLVFVKVPESRPAVAAEAERAKGGGSEGSGSKGSGGGEPAVGMGTVLRDGRFMAVVGLSFLLALLFMQSQVALPVTMAEGGFSTTDYGTAIAVNGVLIIALQLPVTRLIEHRSPRRLLVVASLLGGYGFGLTAFADSLALYALTVCVWTMAEIISSPTQMGLVVRLSPVRGRGRYQGMATLAWAVAALVAPLAGGTVIDRFGAETLWAGCAVVGTVAALGYWALMRGLEPVDDAASGAGEAGATGGVDATGGAAEPASPAAERPATTEHPATAG
ncbi:MDR family MFS transporter [Streptomyces albireticuli]|nr:MFS transporter [Streptomyces albireticuli]MCD9143041.1 MFS transporter [Streptomyces albireticuli]MCD9165284.1 MFS transporter [Streptomyces albireticuli]MCD9192198.1 MFS transporter [Streptomyces albireticuli]